MKDTGFNTADEFLSIREEENRIKFKKRKMRARCLHVRKNSQIRLKQTNSENMFECKDCKVAVDLRPYVNEDKDKAMERLARCADELINALHIVKFRSAITKDKDSQRVAERCANLILEIGAVPDLLDAVIRGNDKRNKDKKKKKGMLVAMGGDSLRFGNKKKGGGKW